MNILVVPDVHVGVGDDLTRLEALGKFITKRKPDVVVQLGDFADMYSLSGFDSSLAKAKVVGDYQTEVESVHAGLSALFAPLAKLQKKQRKNKKKIYTPRTILTYGNHEARYARVIEKDPLVLARAISKEDLDYENFFDEVYDYKIPVEVGGIQFVHNLTTMMGRPLGGAVNPARAALNHAKQSVVVGHSHLYDYSVATRADGSKLHGLVAGCFIGDQEFEYAKGQQHLWTDGVTMLNNVKDGNYELEFISTDRLIENYI